MGAAALALALLSSCADAGVRSTGAELDSGSSDPGAPLEVDPDTTVLTLDNGLQVYLRSNDRPGESAELRLAIDAGSAMETAEQSGVAHFLEHMLFNGTEEFPHNELIDVLRGFGMQFGADVNAYTSYDETVFELTVPLDDESNLGTGLDVLEQWLTAATIDPAEVEAERGVVLDEWRVRDQTLDGRIYETYQDMFLTGTPYEGRAPIGGEDAISSMTAPLVRDFYDTWYRPDNAAIVVVGDIDVDEVEQMVRDRFEGAAPRGDAVTAPDLTIAPYTAPLARVMADPDQTEAVAELTWPGPAAPAGTQATSGALHDMVVDQLAFDMIANRLSDDVTRGDAPFRTAFTSSNDMVRTLDAPSVVVQAESASLDAAVDALVVEFERARRHGFDDNELERAVSGYRSNVEQDYEARDTRQDRNLADSFVGNFLEGDPIPTPRDEYEAKMAALDTVTADEVAAAFVEHVGASAPYLFVGAPEGQPDLPTEADLLALFDDVAARDIPPREESAPVADALMAAPDPVEESSSDKVYEDAGRFLDVTRLEFPNGAVVLLDPTPITDGSVSVEAFSPGGTTELADDDVVMARYATQVAMDSGLGDLDAVAVRTLLSGSSVALQPWIDETGEGVYGDTGTEDLELSMQLIHQWLVAPRFDQAALDASKAADQPYLDDPNADPDYAAYAAMQEARHGDDPRYAVLPTQEQLDALTTDDLERIFTDRFASASDWTFAFVGDIDVDTATELARRYIGSLPSDGSEESGEFTEPPPPDGVVTREVRAGTGGTAQLQIQYETDITADDVPVYGDLLTNVLQTRLTDHIREELGASYSPDAYVSVDPLMYREVISGVQVSGDPDEMDALRAAVHDDLVDIATNGPTQEEFDAAVAAMEQEYQYTDNGTLAWELVLDEHHPGEIDDYMGRYASLQDVTFDDLAAFAARALPVGDYIEIVVLPR